MNKQEEIANEIIDDVCEVVENNYPELKPKHITDDESIESPALINGTIYYNLESKIADKIKARIKKLMKLFEDDLVDVCEDNQIMNDEINLYFKDKSKELFEDE